MSKFTLQHSKRVCLINTAPDNWLMIDTETLGNIFRTSTYQNGLTFSIISRVEQQPNFPLEWYLIPEFWIFICSGGGHCRFRCASSWNERQRTTEKLFPPKNAEHSRAEIQFAIIAIDFRIYFSSPSSPDFFRKKRICWGWINWNEKEIERGKHLRFKWIPHFQKRFPSERGWGVAGG